MVIPTSSSVTGRLWAPFLRFKLRMEERACHTMNQHREVMDDMRIEEMTADDIRQLAAFCDTALITFGGASWRPAHLPIGASWFVLRRLRDILEGSLGGRIVTLPVIGINIQGQESAIFQISQDAATELIRHAIEEIASRLPVRFFVFLTDSLEAEQAFVQAINSMAQRNDMKHLSYLWWRDGLNEVQAPVYERSGEMETSLLMSIAKRLIDLEQKSATRHSALLASEEAGNAYWAGLEKSLLEQVQALWMEGNFKTVV